MNTWAITVILSMEVPNGITLLLIILRWSFSISDKMSFITPFLFLQYTLTRTSVSSEILTSISGDDNGGWPPGVLQYEISPAEEEISSEETEIRGRFEIKEDILLWVLLADCSSRSSLFSASSILMRSWSCSRYFMAPPRTDALSNCQKKKKIIDNLVSYYM